ncbi:MAG TPA: flagellar FliJ family protein [Nocardioidaceae bacterium]|jgi:flagellar export protein FliJ
MTRRVHDTDRALAAVRRVREAREQDSRLGLQQALATSRAREAAAERARVRVEQAPAFGGGTPGDFWLHVRHGAALAQASAEAARQAENGRLVAEEAAGRWRHDRQQVRVADLLLDRRAEERRAERARREQRELDDLAAQGWLRRLRDRSPEVAR